MTNGTNGNAPNQQFWNDFTPWTAVLIAVFAVVVLSAFTATKKIAYWIGAIVLLVFFLPAWRKAGYPVRF